MTGAAAEAAVDAAAGRLAQMRERARGGAAPELAGPDGPAADAAGEVLEIRPGTSAAADSRHGAEDALHSRTAATQGSTAGEGAALPEGFELLTREARQATAPEGSLEKATDGLSAPRDKESLAGSGRVGVFDQIVQRAAVQLRNEQSEINIDLKPDFLGRVRMQVLSENQQVSVRIFAELPAVRDMIETGLHLLRSELQSQGLQVERLEVAVADDHRQNGWQHAPPPAWQPAGGEVAGVERPASEERTEAAYDRSRSRGAAGIDMFV